MNKVLVTLIIPKLGYKYDVLIPLNRRVYNVIKLLVEGLEELTHNEYNPSQLPRLYDKISGKCCDINATIGELGITNGTELILI